MAVVNFMGRCAVGLGGCCVGTGLGVVAFHVAKSYAERFNPLGDSETEKKIKMYFQYACVMALVGLGNFLSYRGASFVASKFQASLSPCIPHIVFWNGALVLQCLILASLINQQ